MCLPLLSMSISDAKEMVLTTNATTKVLSQVYKDISGFGISAYDEKQIKDQGGASTYGEILPESVTQLIEILKIGPSTVFYDLGSGVGKVAMQIHLQTPAKKVVGVELSTERHKNAQVALDRLKQYFKKNNVPSSLNSRRLIFAQGDAKKQDLSDATAVYLCSTCFSTELLQQIMEQIKKAKKGTKVVTLKQLPADPAFKKIKELSLPMTWSNSSNVYIYELQ